MRESVWRVVGRRWQDRYGRDSWQDLEADFEAARSTGPVSRGADDVVVVRRHVRDNDGGVVGSLGPGEPGDLPGKGKEHQLGLEPLNP